MGSKNDMVEIESLRPSAISWQDITFFKKKKKLLSIYIYIYTFVVLQSTVIAMITMVVLATLEAAADRAYPDLQCR